MAGNKITHRISDEYHQELIELNTHMCEMLKDIQLLRARIVPIIESREIEIEVLCRESEAGDE